MWLWCSTKTRSYEYLFFSFARPSSSRVSLCVPTIHLSWDGKRCRGHFCCCPFKTSEPWRSSNRGLHVMLLWMVKLDRKMTFYAFVKFVILKNMVITYLAPDFRQLLRRILFPLKVAEFFAQPEKRSMGCPPRRQVRSPGQAYNC